MCLFCRPEVLLGPLILVNHLMNIHQFMQSQVELMYEYQHEILELAAFRRVPIPAGFGSQILKAWR